MTAGEFLSARQRQAQVRILMNGMAFSLPLVLMSAVIAWRLGGAVAAALIGLAGVGGALGLAISRARRLDRRWLARELDARVQWFEDSGGLVLGLETPSSAFAALQRARVEARVAGAPLPDLRPPWSLTLILGTWTIATATGLAALFWPTQEVAQTAPVPVTANAPPAAPPVVTSTRLRITPPAYTGLPVREQTTLDASVPEGSRVEWRIGIEPPPKSARLAFTETGAANLARAGADWTAARLITGSLLYRLEAEGLARQRLHRIDAVADAPPTVRLISPESQLVQMEPGQTRWTPVFEVDDDYGVSASATLTLTVTKGDGENITFERRSRTVQGQGDQGRRRFTIPLTIAAEGMEPGSDLIVQLNVRDNRAPRPHVVDGPSVILRWPRDLVMADGLDGMALRTLPAYFRSQRQIIIDTEALIAERRRLTREVVMDRANRLGEDQASLRLRYGQFMGEEAEGGGGGQIILPTSDAPPARPPLPTNDAPPATTAPSDHDHDDHEHAEASGEQATRLGSDVDVLNTFGHNHDNGEAATLFAPRTRSTLARALDAMWASERELRQGRLEQALPHAYEALDLLKEAQQATRIFLARTSSTLPPVDFSRRLTGDRDDIVAEASDAPERQPPETVAAEVWRALDGRPGPSTPLALDRLERWVRANRDRLSDPLGVLVAIDTVRGEPACVQCRQRLRALLWTALDRPPGLARRETPDARGRRYLEALR